MDKTTNTGPVAFDSSLTVGMKVVARWTNCHRYYSAPATIAKLNGKSVIVTLDAEIRSVNPYDRAAGERVIYPVGRRITLPRLMGQTWSANNCVVSVAA